jgi:hypothetical protein
MSEEQLSALLAELKEWGYPDSVDRSQSLTDLSLRALTNCCL